MATETIKGLFDRWNAALATGDPDAVTALYADDAVLLPTVSNQVRHDHAEIRAYFVEFLRKRPRGTIDEANVRELGDIAINSGVYTFMLTEGGVDTAVPCRFTFVYRRRGEGWAIIEHHSSRMPE